MDRDIVYISMRNSKLKTNKMEQEQSSFDLNKEVGKEGGGLKNETTTNFFKGISYDFKTIISLILSSTESLMNSNKDEMPTELQIIHDNANLLLRMMNQLLNFRKLENNEFELKISETNISSFMSSIFSSFTAEAQKKEINYTFNSIIKGNKIYIDRSLIENSVVNLLSNAFKYTPLKGEVKVNLYEDEESVLISIKDSGIGVSIEERDNIFNPFYQGKNDQQSSSGIGLYIAKEYLKLHKGEIKVISEKNKGAEFVITLPKGKNHFNSDSLIISDDVTNDNIYNESIPSEVIVSPEMEDSNQELVLIIEDNDDLRFFLKSKLRKTYEVHESDGIDIEKKILELIPDVIISDVNLPQKNGFEICEFVKNDERTSHIPVLMLTSLNTDEAHLKGLKSGVDMFLTKPFNLSVLSKSIESLLYNRKQIQKYLKQLSFAAPHAQIKNEEGKNTDKEIAFIGRVNEIINDNLDDSSFTVEILAEELHISRVQLYRKTKAVLGITISDYIQNIRLEKSKELLVGENDLSIADIAYSVGFSSPNYFSTAFKNKYDITPNAFKKS